MKALCVRNRPTPWASMIASGEKTIETRTWPTMYRGPLLIVATGGGKGIPSVAACTTNLVDCRSMYKGDEAAACCPYKPGLFAWILEDTKKIKPFPVCGQLGLFEVEALEQLEEGDDDTTRTIRRGH